jgi:hypothetical protein
VLVTQLGDYVEPEEVIEKSILLHSGFEEPEESAKTKFLRTLRRVRQPLRLREFSLFLGYFFATGIIIPNFDELHYIYVTERRGVS